MQSGNANNDGIFAFLLRLYRHKIGLRKGDGVPAGASVTKLFLKAFVSRAILKDFVKNFSLVVPQCKNESYFIEMHNILQLLLKFGLCKKRYLNQSAGLDYKVVVRIAMH